MTRPTISLAIAQPCHESWAAMTPTAAGRHCAACQTTVVDFTLKTDAEILAYFAQPSAGTCGRFWEDQLARPLQPPAALPTGSRWRTWLAAAAAVWGLREATAPPAAARPPAAEHPPRKTGRPAPAALRPVLRIRGVVRDATTNEPVPGVAVFLKAENRQAITDSAGRFSLRVPAGRPLRAHHALILHAFGYDSQTVAVPPSGLGAGGLTVRLRANGAGDGAQVVAKEIPYQRQMISGGISSISFITPEVPPQSAPLGLLRRFGQWVAKPFRRTQSK